jgi:hypothetical protein
MQAIWVLFVDLVKAFDTIDRELLFEILAKFGIPQLVIYVIRRLYANTKVKYPSAWKRLCIPFYGGHKAR